MGRAWCGHARPTTTPVAGKIWCGQILPLCSKKEQKLKDTDGESSLKIK